MNQELKLTMVSIYFDGKLYTKFMHARYVDGYASISIAQYDAFLNEIGIARGRTYSMGLPCIAYA